MLATSWASMHMSCNKCTGMWKLCKVLPFHQVSWISDSCHKIRRLKILFGAPTGKEPTSLAFRASVLTTTPRHPGTKCINFASSNHPAQRVQTLSGQMHWRSQLSHNIWWSQKCEIYLFWRIVLINNIWLLFFHFQLNNLLTNWVTKSILYSINRIRL